MRYTKKLLALLLTVVMLSGMILPVTAIAYDPELADTMQSETEEEITDVIGEEETDDGTVEEDEETSSEEPDEGETNEPEEISSEEPDEDESNGSDEEAGSDEPEGEGPETGEDAGEDTEETGDTDEADETDETDEIDEQAAEEIISITSTNEIIMTAMLEVGGFDDLASFGIEFAPAEDTLPPMTYLVSEGLKWDLAMQHFEWTVPNGAQELYWEGRSPNSKTGVSRIYMVVDGNNATLYFLTSSSQKSFDGPMTYNNIAGKMIKSLGNDNDNNSYFKYAIHEVTVPMNSIQNGAVNISAGGAPGHSIRETFLYTNVEVVNRYTVIYDRNGFGDWKNSDETYTGLRNNDNTPAFGSRFNDGRTPSSSVPGYAFTGWNTKADGSGTSYTIVPAKVTGDVTYYAQWLADESITKEISYFVEYYLNGFKDSSKTQQVSADVWAGSNVLPVDESSINKEDAFGAGYKFTGTSPEEIPEEIEANGVICVYYEKDESQWFTITYLPGDEGAFTAQEYDDLLIGSETPAFEGEPEGNYGWVFDGWSPKVAETVTGDAAYTAQWVKDLELWHIVKYLPGSEGTFEAQEYEDILRGTETPAFDGEPAGNYGWEFAGWLPEVAETVEEDATYVAQWAKDPNLWFSVTYLPGTQGTFEEQTHGNILNNTARPEFEGEITGNYGWIFTDWDPGLVDAVTENAVYTAQWEKDETLWHTVTYLPGTQGTFAAQEYSDILRGEETPAFEGDITGQPHWVFTGWSPAVTDTVTGDVEYTAQWSIEIVVTVTASSNLTVYDGTEQSAEGYSYKVLAKNGSLISSSSNVNGFEVSAQTQDPSSTDVTLQTNKLSGIVVTYEGVDVNELGNIKVTLIKFDGVLKILPRAIEITALSATQEYNGKELTAGWELTRGSLADGQKIADEDVTMTGSQLFTGWSLNRAKDAIVTNEDGETINSKNYIILYKPGLLVVTKNKTAVIRLIAASDAKVYDGEPLTNGGSIKSISVDNRYIRDFSTIGITDITVDVDGSQTEAGSSANEVTGYELWNGTKNVTGMFNEAETKDGILRVVKRPLMIAAASDSKLYDGTPLTNDGYSVVRPTSLASGQDINAITIKGSQTYTGWSKNIASNAVIFADDEDVTPNYAIVYIPGALVVKSSEDQIVITANSNSKPYDGTPLTDGGYTWSDLPGGITRIDAEVTGSQTETGDSANVITDYTLVYETDNGEQDVTKMFPEPILVDGTLAVTEIELTIKTEGAAKTYDGTELTNPNYEIISGKVADGQVLKVVVTGKQLEIGSSDNFATATVWGNKAAEETEENAEPEPEPSNSDFAAFTIAADPEDMIDVSGNYIISYEFGKLTVTEPEPEPTEEPGEEPEPTEEPGEEPGPTEEPGEEPGPTEEPGEEPGPTEEPGEEPGPTEEPGTQPQPTEEPGEEPGPAASGDETVADEPVDSQPEPADSQPEEPSEPAESAPAPGPAPGTPSVPTELLTAAPVVDGEEAEVTEEETTEEQDEDEVDVDEIETPLADIIDDAGSGEAEIIDIEEIEIPLAQGTSWHLWNLILSLAGIALAIAMGVRAIAGNKKKEDDGLSEEPGTRKKNIVLSIAVPVAAIAASILFMLTQDMSAPMAMVDGYTAAHAGLFLAGLASFIFADRKVKEEEQVTA